MSQLIDTQYEILLELYMCAHSYAQLLKECNVAPKCLTKALSLLIKQGSIVRSSLTNLYELVPEHYADRRYTKC